MDALRFVMDVRLAGAGDIGVLARIGSEGFHDDPVMSWVFPDPATRLEKLHLVFGGLAADMISGGVVHIVEEACAGFWRDPTYEHGRVAADRVEESAEATGPFAADELTRLRTLGDTMMAAHPHERHWYLNVLSTLPARQGQGLGAKVLVPVLAECDSSRTPAYLESSNPRNLTLYRRHGFIQTGELPLPDGLCLYPMWREPA